MAALLNWRTDRGLALDVSSLPGVESLSQIERKLCSSIRLTPVHYLVGLPFPSRPFIPKGAPCFVSPLVLWQNRQPVEYSPSVLSPPGSQRPAHTPLGHSRARHPERRQVHAEGVSPAARSAAPQDTLPPFASPLLDQPAFASPSPSCHCSCGVICPLEGAGVCRVPGSGHSFSAWEGSGDLKLKPPHLTPHLCRWMP